MVHAKQAAAKRAGVAKDDDDDNDDEHLPAGPLRTTVGISRAKFLALVEASTSTLSKTDIVEFLSMSDQEAEKATREPSRRYMKACVWWHMGESRSPYGLELDLTTVPFRAHGCVGTGQEDELPGCAEDVC